MAAIDFPNSPTQGDTFTASDKTWVYIDGKWTLPSVDANGLVTLITSASSGQFLKWNGSAWVNDTIDLGTDTAGNYVSGVSAGTGISITHTPGEGSTATVGLNATLDNLSNVTVPSPTTNDVLQWNGTAWVNVAASTVGATNLDGLSDVVISTPEEFQTLEYNGTNWVNTYSPLVSYVRNAEATTLTTGTCVYLFGSTGDHATVKRADNGSDTTSSKTVGVVGANIISSENGPVVTRGYVDGIDLSVGYVVGDVLWLGENGAFTKTKPSAPDHLVFIGVVVRATNNGIIYVATQNGYELDELHDVSIVDKTSGDFLKYNGSLWVNDQINLGTDTVGSYVSSLVAGNNITLTNNSGEGATPTINSGVTISDNIPSSPTAGQVWYESDTGKTFVYYDSFWIELVGSTGAQGPTGAEGGTTTLTTKGDLLTRSASAVARLPVGATNGHVLTVDSAEASGMKWAAAVVGGMTQLDAQTFTSSTTYTVVAGAKLILVECVAAGAGGTGGARNTGTTGTTGSPGGSGGAWEQVSIPVSELGGAGASVTVTIGAGGAGGAGRSGSSGSGIAGSIGGDSRFGTYYFGGAKLQSAYGLVSGYVQVLTEGYGYRGSGGGSGGSGGGAGRSGFRGGAGGGGGGSITTITRIGGEGGGYSTQPTSTSTLTYIATSGGGAAGGAAGGGAGEAGASFGIGGGGGGSSNTATGGAGGAGGTGAGGGGGGNANNDNDGGAGGNGGDAQIKIWVFG